MGPLDRPLVFAQDPALGGNDHPIRVDPQADGPVGETRLLRSTMPSKADGSGIRSACSSTQTSAMVPGSTPCGISRNSSRQRRSSQAFRAARSGKRGIGCHRRGRASWTSFSTCPFSHPDAGLQNCGSKTSFRHGEEAHVDLPLLAEADAVNRRLHVVMDAAPRHATEDAEPMPVSVEQHLVGLQQLGPEQEGQPVCQLEIGDLKLRALPTQDCVVLASVELERLARAKG